MLCVSVAWCLRDLILDIVLTTRAVMTIREKFADLRFYVTKAKDTSMVFFNI